MDTIPDLHASLRTHGVKATCQQYGLTYYRLQQLRRAAGIDPVASYPLQSILLGTCCAQEGQTIATMRVTLLAEGREYHRQALWAACQALVRKQLLRKTGAGLEARYWKPTIEREKHGLVS